MTAYAIELNKEIDRLKAELAAAYSKLDSIRKYCLDGQYDDGVAHDGHSQACNEILSLLE